MDQDEQHLSLERRIALDARDWIVRLSSGDVDEALLARFKAWREGSPAHARAFERERAFWQGLKVLDRTAQHPPAPALVRRAVNRRTVLLGGGALAAGAAGLVVAPRLMLRWRADYLTAVGEQSRITLPDGSQAVLNTDSAVALHFREGERRLELLAGEVEVRVRPQPASPFRLSALGGETRTKAGTFAVRTAAETATVILVDGEAQVFGSGAGARSSVALAASQQTRYADGGAPVPPVHVDAEALLAWRTGRIVFEGEPFGAAVAELARYLPERVVVAPGIDGDDPVSAIFATREAFQGLEALAQAQGLSARRIPGVVIVIS